MKKSIYKHRYNDHKRVRYSRKEYFLRVLLILFIVSGLFYSIYSMFKTKDLYVSLQGMINDGKFKKVEKLTKKLYSQNPLDVKTLRLMGKNYFLQAMKIDHVKKDQTEEGWELFKKAVESFKKAILLDKKNIIDSKDYLIIGFSYMKKGDSYFKDALRYFKLAENVNDKDEILAKTKEKLFNINTLYKLMGYLYYKVGSYKDALTYYNKANKQKEVLNYLYIALCQRNLKYYKKAVKTFSFVYDYANVKSLKLVSLQNLGWLYFHLGKYKESESIYNKSIGLDSNYAEGYYWKGKIEEHRGNKKKAIEFWKKCLEKDQNFGPAILKMKNLKQKF